MNGKIKVIIASLFISSLISSLSSKYQLMTFSDGSRDASGKTLRQFSHPWFQVIIMFAGECCCLIIYKFFIQKHSSEDDLSISNDDDNVSVDNSQENHKIIRWSLLVPTLCDLSGSALSGFANLWIDLSLLSILGGLSMVVTAIFAKIFLKRKLGFNHYFGICISMCGFVIIGISEYGSVRWTSDSDQLSLVSSQVPFKLKALGFIFVLIYVTLGAAQVTLEESIMRSRNVHPALVVGCEGIFGLTMSLILSFAWYYVPGPVQPRGNMDDILDALVQLVHSPMIMVTTVLFFLAIPVVNFSAQSITKYLSGLDRCMIGNVRTLLTWSIQVFVYYVLKLKNYGEPIDEYFLIKADGFFLMVLGALVFNIQEDVRSYLPTSLYYEPISEQNVSTSQEI